MGSHMGVDVMRCYVVGRQGTRVLRRNHRDILCISRLLHIFPHFTGSYGRRRLPVLFTRRLLHRFFQHLQPRLGDGFPRVVETEERRADVSMGNDKHGAVRGTESRILRRARERSGYRKATASVFGLYMSFEVLRCVRSGDVDSCGHCMVRYAVVFLHGRSCEVVVELVDAQGRHNAIGSVWTGY